MKSVSVPSRNRCDNVIFAGLPSAPRPSKTLVFLDDRAWRQRASIFRQRFHLPAQDDLFVQ